MARPWGTHGTYCLDCEAFDCRHTARSHHLTARELMVLRMVGEGRTNKAAAYELGVVEGTFKVYVSGIYGKLPPTANGTNARMAAAQWWLSHPELHERVKELQAQEAQCRAARK